MAGNLLICISLEGGGEKVWKFRVASLKDGPGLRAQGGIGFFQQRTTISVPTPRKP